MLFDSCRQPAGNSNGGSVPSIPGVAPGSDITQIPYGYTPGLSYLDPRSPYSVSPLFHHLCAQDLHFPCCVCTTDLRSYMSRLCLKSPLLTSLSSRVLTALSPLWILSSVSATPHTCPTPAPAGMVTSEFATFVLCTWFSKGSLMAETPMAKPSPPQMPGLCSKTPITADAHCSSQVCLCVHVCMCVRAHTYLSLGGVAYEVPP